MENLPSQRTSWISLLGAPILWAIHFLGVWIISEVGCRLGGASTRWFGTSVIHVLTLGLSLLVLILMFSVGWISFTWLRKISLSDSDTQDLRRRKTERIRFMVQIGFLFTLLFFLISAYITSTIFVIPLCQ